MTTSALPHTSAPTAPAGSATGKRRRWRWVAGAIGLAAVVGLIVLTGGQRSTVDLDPRNPGPAGAQALAEVLKDQGIEVEIVRSFATLQATTIDSQTTLIVTSAPDLGSTSVDTLVDLSPGSLVLVNPTPEVGSRFGADLRNQTYDERTTRAECQGDDLQGRFNDLTIRSIGPVTEWSSPNGCFYADGGALLAEPRAGVLVLGAPGVISNARIEEADNAAVALRLLGSTPRVVWYVADPTDRAAGEARSLESLLPPWIRPALWLIACSVIALIIWRGRRLGRLISEPLPIAIVAIESTRSRGRLYRKANDRTHAASALRLHACTDISDRLALGKYTIADTPNLVASVAKHTGRPVAELDFLLNPNAPAPASDTDLVALANTLQSLTEEVHRHD